MRHQEAGREAVAHVADKGRRVPVGQVEEELRDGFAEVGRDGGGGEAEQVRGEAWGAAEGEGAFVVGGEEAGLHVDFH